MNQEELSDLSDAQLVAKSIENPYEFAQLMERYEARLKRYILRISSVSEQDAEDILQETFIKAYYNLRGYDTGRSFSSWIYRIAHNQTISTYRKKSVRPEGHVIDVEDSVIDQLAADGDIGASIDRTLLRETIGEILPKLDWKYREIIVLRYFQGYSYGEIADILQKPEGSIATLLHRAKKKFRTLLEASEKNL